MDTLLSQLKGQGSPFASHSQAHVEKLLDTIHLLSQATVIVAQQLQRPTPPSTTPTKPLSLPMKPKKTTPQSKKTTSQSTASPPKPSPPTPPSSPPSLEKKKKTTTTHPQLPLQWVPRSPDYYSTPTTTTPTRYTSPTITSNASPATTTATTTSSNHPISLTRPKKNAWDHLGSSLFSPSPTPLPTTLKPTSAPDPSEPTPLPKPIDQELIDRALHRAAKRGIRTPTRTLTPSTCTTTLPANPSPSPPTHTDDAPANNIVNFPHSTIYAPNFQAALHIGNTSKPTSNLTSHRHAVPLHLTLSYLQQQVLGFTLQTGFGTP